MSLKGAFEAAALGLWGPCGGWNWGASVISEKNIIGEATRYTQSYQVYRKLTKDYRRIANDSNKP